MRKFSLQQKQKWNTTTRNFEFEDILKVDHPRNDWVTVRTMATEANQSFQLNFNNRKSSKTFWRPVLTTFTVWSYNTRVTFGGPVPTKGAINYHLVNIHKLLSCKIKFTS